MDFNAIQTAILDALRPTDAYTLTVCDCCTSTNTLLRRHADAGAPQGTALLARSQTAGKGRQGRCFHSPAQTGLYLSVLYRPDFPAEQAALLTPMAAVAAAEAIESILGEYVQIKWVNDLFLHGKKICGILAEAAYSSKAAALDYVVLGIGINLLPPPEGFPPELQSIAGVCFPADTDPDTALIRTASALLRALTDGYAGCLQKAYLPAYRERLCVLNRPIIVSELGIDRPAIALEMDDDLRLLVRYADGSEQWRSTGEIRLRIEP